MTMGDKRIGADLSKWYIQRIINGRWNVCPPVNHDDPEWWTRGGSFNSGAEAFLAYTAGAKLAAYYAIRERAASVPHEVAVLTEACRGYQWLDGYGARWFYRGGEWHWENEFLPGAIATHCHDEAEVAAAYTWAGPFTRLDDPTPSPAPVEPYHGKAAVTQ